MGLFKGQVFSKTFLIALYCSIGGFLYGFDSGIITPLLVLPRFVAYFQNPTPAQRGAIVACFQVGALFGSLSVGFLSDRLGRKRAMFIGTLFGILGGALMSGAAHIAMLVIGRLCVGACVGLVTSVAPVYAAEIAKSHERGRIAATQQFLIAMGFLVANWTGYGFKFVAGDSQWRAPFGIQMVPAFVLACGVLFLPESPRWLLLRGRDAEAKVIVDKLHFNGQNRAYCDEEYSAMYEKIAIERAVVVRSWSRAFSKPTWRKRVILGAGVWVAGMFSGISFVQYYQPSIYSALNFDLDTQLLITGLYGTTAPIFCVISILTIERFDRTKILGFAGIALCASWSILTALVGAFPAVPGQPSVNPAGQKAAVAMIFMISAIYSGSWGPLGWVYPPEIFPVSIRAIGNSITHVVHYAVSIMITQSSPVALASVGYKYFIMFILSNLISGLVFLFLYPETRGKTLEEIDLLFGDDPTDAARVMQARQAADTKRSSTPDSADEKGNTLVTPTAGNAPISGYVA